MQLSLSRIKVNSHNREQLHFVRQEKHFCNTDLRLEVVKMLMYVVVAATSEVLFKACHNRICGLMLQVRGACLMSWSELAVMAILGLMKC